MKALIEIDVPEWQIGQEVTIHFPDSMCKKGVCKAAISYDRVTREVVGTKDDVKALYRVMLEDYMNNQEAIKKNKCRWCLTCEYFKANTMPYENICKKYATHVNPYSEGCDEHKDKGD